MNNLESNKMEDQGGRPSSCDVASGLDGEPDSFAGGFGTLGASPDEPTSFFGSNAGALIDGGGFLHGLPPCDALSAGFMVFPSLVSEQCIQVHLAQRWPEFAEALEAELEAGAGEGGGPVEPGLRARALSLLASQPERVPFENGTVAIPRAVMDETGIDGSEEVVVTGNDGYFEVANKAVYDEMMQEIDLTSILFGD